MKGVLYHNSKCKVLVVTESEWESYTSAKQNNLNSKYGTDGTLYILPDWTALATDERDYPFDVDGCAKLFKALNENRFRYDAVSKDLYVSTGLEKDSSLSTQGMHWKKDVGENELIRSILLFIDEIQYTHNHKFPALRYPNGVSKDDYEKADEAIQNIRSKLWKRYTFFADYQKNKIASIIKDRTRMDSRVHLNDREKTGSLIPCLNGVYNLGTGKFRSTEPNDYLTLYCPVRYDPAANDPAVREFIAQITKRNPDIEKFLRQIVGVALDLNMPTKTMPQLFGRETNNGKTTFINALKDTFGRYGGVGCGLCCEVNPSAFERGKFGTDRLTPKLAEIGDSRIVFVSEPDQKLAVNTGLLKSLTSAGEFQFEGKFRDPGLMRTLFTIIWETNHLLQIDDSTLFARGTMQVVPFDFHVEKPDQDIEVKLSTPAARSTWLNWAIQGHQEYVANGNAFDVPPICKDLLDSYQNGQRGAIPSFLDEFFEKDPAQKRHVPCREVFSEFKKWAVRTGSCNVEKMLEKDFKKEAQDFVPIDKRNNVDCFIGVVKKQAASKTPNAQSIIDQLFSCELTEDSEENAAIPVRSVLDVCNQMLQDNGLPCMTCMQFADELSKRNLSVSGSFTDPALERWRFLTEDEKADQLHREQDARRQGALADLKKHCDKIEDPELAAILDNLVAKLEKDGNAVDMRRASEILAMLSGLKKAA